MTVQRINALFEGLPASAVCLLAAAGVVAWVALHLLWRGAGRRAVLAVARIAVGSAALLMAAQAAQLWLVLATDWPLWLMALAGAAAVEILLKLYAIERRTVSRPAGLILAGLRTVLALLILLMLTQPVFVLEREEGLRRHVAILVDGSASMQVPDTQLTISEKVRIAETLTPGQISRPHRLEAVAQELESVGSQLATQGEWLAMLAELDPGARRKHLEGRREELQQALMQAGEAVGRQLKAMGDLSDGLTQLDQDSAAALSEAREQLRMQVGDRLQEAAAAAGSQVEAASDLSELEGRLRELIRSATEALGTLAPAVDELGRTLDELYYASLPEERQAAIDALAGQTRLELARQVLFGRPAESGDEGRAFEGLLAGLQGQYGVRAYTFASEPVELDLTAGRDAGGLFAASGQFQTDLAAALHRVIKDIPSRQLAGIIVLTDGRHNTSAQVEPVAGRLGMEQVPVCSVVFGSTRPPTDAAIVSLEAPETVYAADRVHVAAEVKLDGLAGRTAAVTLFRADSVVDSQTIEVPAPEYRTRVELSDAPTEIGLLSYRVRLEAFEDEVLSGNNEYAVEVSVTDDQVRLLIIEGRSRWEFRYLKNLFAGRDKTVKLQHVLFHPERIAGRRGRSPTPASVSRPAGQVEATLLPQDEGEWLKFDVIILGDVSPSDLPLPAQEALRRFVADRGGTLVVIAGPRFMPHAYTGTPLQELLPVLFEPTTADYVATPDDAFRVTLTPEGRHSIIARLKDDPEENAAFWRSRPEIRWRYPIVDVRPRATVLAYASPIPPSENGGEEAGALNTEAASEDRQFQSEHALIVVHNAGLGRVVFLAFDRTWRLRYREGDTYHHKFWGQLLRWATANKLPAGTSLVKIGTDRARYPLHSRVHVRARIMQPDLTPMISDEVAAVVFRDEHLVLRRKLQYIGDVPGMYAADLGELPGGAYRVELHGPQVAALLAHEGADTASVEFAVHSATSTEQTELAADRGLAGMLAELSGGIVVGPSQGMRVLDALGPGLLVLQERQEYPLWSSWPLLALMLLLLTAEWLLRKKKGLP